MIGAAWAAAGLTTKLIAIGSAAAVALATYGIWHHHVWKNGYDDALAAIAKQDAKAIATARQYRDAVRDCRARGLVWDQTTGQCLGR